MESRPKLRVRWSNLSVVLVVLGMALLGAGRAHAQVVDPTTVRIVCTPSATQTCTSASNSLASTTIVSSGLPTLSFTTTDKESGTAYVAVLVPSTTDLSLSFEINSKSGTDEGVFTSGSLIGKQGTTGGFLNLYNYSAGATGQFGPLSNVSALSSTGTTPTGFNVYLFDLGSYSCTDASSCPSLTFTVSGSSLPAGTIFWGFLENSSNQVTDSSPNTELATVTVVPEPATLALLGTGFLLIGVELRKRYATN